MPLSSSERVWNTANVNSPSRMAIAACIVAILSYLISKLGGVLVLQPRMMSPLWLGNVFLVTILLMMPRRIWPLLMASAFAAFVLYDVQADVPIRSVTWLIVADAIEVLTAAACLRYFFSRIPRLNSVKALAKFLLIAVILAPFVGAFVAALATGGNYWTAWRISFFSEALGFLTLMPAILGWTSAKSAWRRKLSFKIETIALMSSLLTVGYFAFIVSQKSTPPALLYSLVPFLLWAALRFGTTGVSTSAIVIAFLSIWGAVHGNGPFNGLEPLSNVLSLQLFLFFAVTPFMFLAALVEERKSGEEELRESEVKFRSIFRDASTGIAIVSPEGKFVACNGAFSEFLGYTEAEIQKKTVEVVTHPDDWPMFSRRLSQACSGEASLHRVEKRCLHKQGKVLNAECSASLIKNAQGKPQYFIAEVLDITERKNAEEVLRENERRFRLVANTAPVMIWMSAPDKLCTFFNNGWLDFTGQSMEHELGEGWASGVHPEDLNRCLEIYSAAFDARVVFEMEYRLRRFDGKYRWVTDSGVPRLDSDETFRGYIGSCMDITDRKLAEASLEELSGRLINAQEAERARIARELHDDFSQRLALHGIGLGQLWNSLPTADVTGREKVREMLRRIQEMSTDMHSLSHQLHSSRLEHVGLGSALEGLCKEMRSKHPILIEFTELAVSCKIPKAVALCLFRIAQEALGNVVKHSQSKQAHAELLCTNNELRLRVTDVGVGFDPDACSPSEGIGLTSMRERLRLVGGTLSIRSGPMQGTEILAQVPLPALSNKDSLRMQATGA